MNMNTESKVKVINGIFGYEVCPKWLSKKYREAVDYTCQMCKKHESEVKKLQPHRTIRKNMGGLYTVLPINHPRSNVQVVCSNCHKLLHSNEFNHVFKSY